MKQCVLLLLMISGGYAQAQQAPASRAPLKIKQIISASHEVVAEYFGTEPLVQGTAVLATFADQRQCALFVDRAIPGHIVLNGKSCDRLAELKVQQDLEFSLVSIAPPAITLETKTEEGAPTLEVTESVPSAPVNSDVAELVIDDIQKRSRIYDLNYLVPANKFELLVGVESISLLAKLQLPNSTLSEEIRNSSSRGRVGLTLGLGDSLNLGIRGSVLFLSRTEMDSVGSIESSGFEDPEANLKWRFASQDKGGPLNLDLSYSYSPKMIKALSGSPFKSGNGGRGSVETAVALTLSRKFVENELLIVATSSSQGAGRSEDAETGGITEATEKSGFGLVFGVQIPVNEFFFFGIGGVHHSYESYETRDLTSMNITRNHRYNSSGILLSTTFLLEPETCVLQITAQTEYINEQKQTVGGTIYNYKDISGARLAASLKYFF